MNLENIRLSERRHSQKATRCKTPSYESSRTGKSPETEETSGCLGPGHGVAANGPGAFSPSSDTECSDSHEANKHTETAASNTWAVSCLARALCLKKDSPQKSWLRRFLKAIYNPNSEKAMAPHSSTLAWQIPWTEEPGRLQSMGSLGVGHN